MNAGAWLSAVMALAVILFVLELVDALGSVPNP